MTDVGKNVFEAAREAVGVAEGSALTQLEKRKANPTTQSLTIGLPVMDWIIFQADFRFPNLKIN
jgi:hypothetical protein